MNKRMALVALLFFGIEDISHAMEPGTSARVITFDRIALRDGKKLTLGWADTDRGTLLIVKRFNGDGSIDRSFNAQSLQEGAPGKVVISLNRLFSFGATIEPVSAEQDPSFDPLIHVQTVVDSGRGGGYRRELSFSTANGGFRCQYE